MTQLYMVSWDSFHMKCYITDLSAYKVDADDDVIMTCYRWTSCLISTWLISSFNDKRPLASRPLLKVKVKGQGHWESSTCHLARTHVAVWRTCWRWRHVVRGVREDMLLTMRVDEAGTSTGRMRAASWRWCCLPRSWTSDTPSTMSSVLPLTLVGGA